MGRPHSLRKILATALHKNNGVKALLCRLYSVIHKLAVCYLGHNQLIMYID